MQLSPVNQGAGLPVDPVAFTFWNRTGATLEPGQFAMCDFAGTQAETTEVWPPKGEGTTPYENVGPVTQAGYDAGFPIVACGDVAIADNAKGLCYVQHPALQAAILDDDVSTTDIDRGDAVAILVSESAVAAQQWATTSTPRAIGIAHEAAAADSADTDRLINASSHRRKICFYGGYPGGVSDT